MLVADTENITAHQWFTERLVASDMLALVKQAVERLMVTRVGMRVNQDILIALLADLRVKARNHQFVDHNVVGRLAANIDDRLVQWERLLFRVDVAADLDRRNATRHANQRAWLYELCAAFCWLCRDEKRGLRRWQRGRRCSADRRCGWRVRD